MPAILVTGLGYGDEGKGAVVDYLAGKHNASGVVFTNGGAQRAHNVVLPGGTHHSFHQYGSASFLPGLKTHHAATSMIDPHAFFLEADDLVAAGVPQPWLNVTVHPDALITTPFHIAVNQAVEIMRKHGSCGMGIGETAYDAIRHPEAAIRARDLLDSKTLYEKLHDAQIRLRRRAHTICTPMPGSLDIDKAFRTLHDFDPIRNAMEIYRIFAKVVPIAELEMGLDETWIFEGSQGVLLDEYNGFHPHTTWSKSAGQNAKDMLAFYSGGEVRHVGVIRSYMTRHGNGPFVTEDKAMDDDMRFAEHHNGLGKWQGIWRRGWTDLEALKYATKVAEPTELAVTHMDRVRGDWKICAGYDEPLVPPSPVLEREIWEIERQATLDVLETAIPEYAEFSDMTPDAMFEVIEAATDLPVTISGHGPTAENFHDHAVLPTPV